ncbi:MAG: folate family ECF transporter S component [Clostridia bacterium]|nr:folate family ECF transporter S component [Clostridia bacterium]MBR0277847.1 folate family ECF transporter S component [Clostridia bacterium]
MFKNFLDSAKSIKNLRVLCATALLSAIYVAIYAVKIPLGDQLRITFTFVPVALAGWLFGIVPAVIVGALGDFLGCYIFPQGAYFWGFTVTAVLTGVIFGLCLYKKDGKKLFWYVALSKFLVSLLLNVGLNSYWATLFVPKSFFVIMWSKVLKNALMLPIEIIVLFAVIEGLKRAGVQKMYK